MVPKVESLWVLETMVFVSFWIVCYVITAVHKNENSQRSSTLHSQCSFNQFASPCKDPPGSCWESQRCRSQRTVTWFFSVLLSSSVRHTILSTVLLVFLDEFVVTKVVILQRTAPLKTVKAWVNQKQVYMVQLFHSTIMLLLFLELKLKSHIVEVYILIFCSHAHYFL